MAAQTLAASFLEVLTHPEFREGETPFSGSSAGERL
jgi:hypothetical protein